MKSKKKKKLDILHRKLRRLRDPNSTYEILVKMKIENKIRMLNGDKGRWPKLPNFIKP